MYYFKRIMEIKKLLLVLAKHGACDKNLWIYAGAQCFHVERDQMFYNGNVATGLPFTIKD